MLPVALLPEHPDEEHFRICQKAEKTLATLSDGNGLFYSQIKLQKHETLVHQLPASLDIVLKPDVIHTEQAGAHPTGETTGSKQDAMSKADSLGATFLKSKEVLDELEKQLELLENKGWGINPAQIPLKQSTKKVYSVVDKCQKCLGTAKMACALCMASGVIACATCQGQGNLQCQQCFGSGRANNSDGSQSPCQLCQSTGRISCRTCNAMRTVMCTTCKGAKATMCRECTGSGSFTHIFNVTYHADVSFVLDRNQTPEDVLAVVDHFGVKTLASKQRAEIFRLPFALVDTKGHYPVIAFLPIAKGEISIAGKHEEMVVAGLQGEVVEIAPYLDPYLKPGIAALLKLAKGPMAAEALIKQALKFKILRATLSGLMHQSKKAVFVRLQKEYPLIVSEKYAKACVKYAANAVLALGEGPRTKGLLFGTLGSLALSALYFLSPVRASVNAALTAKNLGQHILLADILTWVLGYVLTLFVIKFMASKALRGLLPDDGDKKRGLPAAGKQGGYALLTCFGGWFACALFAASKPAWILALLKVLHL